METQLRLDCKEIKDLLKNKVNLVIEYCTDTESPREWDNLGTMITRHSRYSLGDNYEHRYMVDIEEELKELDLLVKMPLYLYDHSGISMSCGRSYPYNCRWDSMHLGFIYVEKEKVRKEFNVKRISKKLKERVMELLEGEVDTYSSYISGDVYSYSLIDILTGEDLDSCCGFYGNNPKENGMLDHINLNNYEIVKTIYK